MKKILPACLLACALSGAAPAATLWTEGFEDSFPPAGWITNSVDQSSTYAFNGTYSARLNATADYLITPPITNAQTLIFWSYTTSSDPAIVVEYSASQTGPWSEAAESPFSGYTEQWNGQWIAVPSTNLVYVRFRKTGTGTLYLDDLSVEDGVVISNQPPVLNPIGNQAVLEMGTLSFSVTASDPVDHDGITLSATHLPTGATFSTNGLFVWSNAVPVGTYSVTFYATDKDGSTTETIDITVLERPKLFISEIADPSGTGADVYRFVELYNAGTNTIDLAADSWTLSKQVNGGTWYDVPLTGTIAPDAARVIAYSAAAFQDAYGFAPDQKSSTISGNGDDAYFLYYSGGHTSGVLIDIYGAFNTDGTDTAWDYEDSRAVRNNNILQPNTVWTAAEWTITPGAQTGDMTPGAHGPVPEFQGLENQFVFLGDSLSLAVTAVNTVRTDIITLSPNALPAGATFPPATGTNTVSSVLTWNSPPAGVYTATFAAAGAAGTQTASITITVSSRSQIDGYFYGWKTDTIVKLKNGQFWKNTGGVGSTYPGFFNLGVSVTNQFGSLRMVVDQVTGHTTVAQIQITESSVTNAFNGLHYQNVYQLADGTVWKQVSFEAISSTASPVTVWRWVESGVQKMRFVDRNDVVIGTCVIVASTPPANAPIVSAINGWFRGWKSKRVFILKNGQFWQQTSLDSSEQTLYSPTVTVTNYLQTGSWRMSVAGLTGYVSVQQLTNVTRTAIDGNFYGFGSKRIFKFTDGSWWKQSSSESSTSTRSGPEILIWSENGIDYLEMPDEGLRVAAKQLDVQFESAVTNAFTGLHYGNLYRLDGAGDWIQLSFENVSASITQPTVMVWAEGMQTNMIVRNSSAFAIGSCVVASPSAATGVSARSLRLPAPAPSGNVLRWNTIQGCTYTIEWTPSLTESFQTLENSIVWPQNSWTDTVHTVETEGFYRIGVRLAD